MKGVRVMLVAALAGCLGPAAAGPSTSLGTPSLVWSVRVEPHEHPDGAWFFVALTNEGDGPATVHRVPYNCMWVQIGFRDANDRFVAPVGHSCLTDDGVRERVLRPGEHLAGSEVFGEENANGTYRVQVHVEGPGGGWNHSRGFTWDGTNAVLTTP